MNEQAVTFGEADKLVGVLTEANAGAQRPHVLILNSGVVHHVGPGRIGVEIARHLAAAGFPSLRFDFSGIGDSAPRVPSLDPIACGIADARDAMDYLGAAHGARRFILLGLCSGARHAHYIATADERVVGAVLLDGYAFSTARSHLIEFAVQLQQPIALLAGMVRRVRRMLTSKPIPLAIDVDSFFPKDPTRFEMARDLAALAARNVNLLCIFTGEWSIYRYEGQFSGAFRGVHLEPILTERRIDAADHLYFTRPERTAMLAMITSWLKLQYQEQHSLPFVNGTLASSAGSLGPA
jgi:pimeloyl-ACP methyl ester carboxylesterase